MREEVKDIILNIPNNNIMLELPTGYGKSKLALDKLNSLVETNNNPKILILIPKLLLINNWKEEFTKWGYDNLLNYTTFSTYNSIQKHIGYWDVCIFDECHHLSERCQLILKKFDIKNSILLSATVKKNLKRDFTSIFKNLYFHKVTTKEAINNEVLPDPTVYLIPLTLNTSTESEKIIKNSKGYPTLCIKYKDRWAYSKEKKKKIIISCTPLQYINDLNSQIDWYKRRYMITRNDIFKNRWLKLCGDRLKWLSDKKTTYVKYLLSKLINERTLTFCNGIEQTQQLGKYCINSKNKESENILEDFNNGVINHITACNMLNEGTNLSSCRIGIYANLNSSETIVTQRLGRILRHQNPIIIIPYYANTREEEIVKTMLENYNPFLIHRIDNLNDLKI